MAVCSASIYVTSCWRVGTKFFFFNDTATTEIYTLSLHDALPISTAPDACATICELIRSQRSFLVLTHYRPDGDAVDRKSTRLNSSHDQISYAVFCLIKNVIGLVTVGGQGIGGCSDAHERAESRLV